MANFLDLPLQVRQKIYRLHLVQDKPMDLIEHQKMVGLHVHWEDTRTRRFGPPILLLSPKVDREAAPIYYGENEFDFGELNNNRLWVFRTMTFPRHLRLIEKVTCYINPTGTSILDSCRTLGKMKGLERLRIGVDEQAMQARTRSRRATMQWQQSRSESTKERTGAQQQLSMLCFPGISGLLSLSDIPDFEFTDRQATTSSKTRGLIPGGFLETQVLPKIRSSGNVAHRGQQDELFRFLDLPAELRNNVYEILLRFDGPVHPSKEAPTSSIAHRAHTRPADRPDHPRSALSILGVNRQVRDEAVGMFYSNSFVFYYPSQLSMFLLGLSQQRLSFIKDLTVYYRPLSQGGVDIVDIAFMPLRQLTNLRRLHVLMNGDLDRKVMRKGWAWGSQQYHLRNANPVHLPGMKMLFELRGLTDIKVRDLELEEAIADLKKETKYPNFANDSREGMRVKLSSVLDHFNEALKKAQLGHVCQEMLEDKEWQIKDDFPTLE